MNMNMKSCCNLNIGFKTKSEVQGPIKARVCLGVKHALKNEWECKGWSPMTPKCTPTLGVALMRELRMFRALVRRSNKHKIGPPNNIKKVLKLRCFKCPCMVHLNLICMNYDQKKGREWEFDSRLQISWKKESNKIQLKRVIHRWKDIFKSY
jgi:hypothetical protein